VVAIKAVSWVFDMGFKPNRGRGKTDVRIVGKKDLA
jgi:hypothetical protein